MQRKILHRHDCHQAKTGGRKLTIVISGLNARVHVQKIQVSADFNLPMGHEDQKVLQCIASSSSYCRAIAFSPS